MFPLFVLGMLAPVGLVLLKYILLPIFLTTSTDINSLRPKHYPHKDPLFGLDLALETWRDFRTGQLSEGLRRRHLTHGPTFTTKTIFGGADTMYTIDPANIRAITTADFAKFGKSSWVGEAAKHIGAGVLLNEGGAWKHSRTMLKPIFSRTAAGVGMDEPTVLEPHVRRLVDGMRARAWESAGGVVEFHGLSSMFTLDVVTEFLFGKSTKTLADPRDEEAQDAVRFLGLVKEFEGPSGKFIALGAMAWPGLLPKYRRLIAVVNGMKAFFKRRLEEIMRVEGDSKSPSVFRAMKAAGVPEAQIQGELQNIFFASYDTTSTFLANLMYVLVRHPEVQQQLREEIAFLDGRAPTRKELGQMQFLRMVLMEALRLYSPVTSHSRTAKVDTTLPHGGGEDGQSPITVRAGTTIVWSTYALNRDPRWYGDDWAKFKPSRWASLRERSDFYMPFGSGPRSCLGQQMVQTEVMYTLVRLLQAFVGGLGAVQDKHGEEEGFREAEAVSFYNSGGVRICVR